MPEIRSIGQSTVGPVRRTDTQGAPFDSVARPTNDDAPRRDRVELSDHARLMEKLHRLPEGRTELIDRVRDAIADGTYETDTKLRVTIDRLIDDLS